MCPGISSLLKGLGAVRTGAKIGGLLYTITKKEAKVYIQMSSLQVEQHK